MDLFAFLKKPRVKKTWHYGQAIGNFLRRKVEEKLYANECREKEPILTPHNAIKQELFKNIQQFQAILNSGPVIGFLAVDFFLSKSWQHHGASLNLSKKQKKTLDQAYDFLCQCNSELEGMEVSKEGFVKGQLSNPLLKSGINVLQKAIEALHNSD